MWAKKRTDSPSAATASGVLCQLRCHTCLELGGVAVRFKRNCRFVPQREARPIADVPLVLAAPERDFAAPGASLFSNREPLLFLFRQHISPHALFMQPRPCQIMRISGAPRNLLMCRA